LLISFEDGLEKSTGALNFWSNATQKFNHFGPWNVAQSELEEAKEQLMMGAERKSES
jgi:hypothetical protein